MPAAFAGVLVVLAQAVAAAAPIKVLPVVQSDAVLPVPAAATQPQVGGGGSGSGRSSGAGVVRSPKLKTGAAAGAGSLPSVAMPQAPQIPQFDPLVPEADFGAPLPVAQTQYVVVGPHGIKPLQVYNDAQNTHIALADHLDRPSVLVPARGGLHPQQSWVRGNQMLVRGVPAEIVLSYPDGRHISITRVTDPLQRALMMQVASAADPSVAASPSSPSGSSAFLVSLDRQLGALQGQQPQAEGASDAQARVQQLAQQRQQMVALYDQLRLAQYRIQELQEQITTDQAQKLSAQVGQQEALAQKQEALAQMHELQAKISQLRLASPAAAQPAAPDALVAAAPSPVAVAPTRSASDADTVAGGGSSWVLQAGDTVSGALSRWAAASGRKLVWSPKVDIPVNRAKKYSGVIQSALQQLAQDLSRVLPIVIQIESEFILVGNAP